MAIKQTDLQFQRYLAWDTSSSTGVVVAFEIESGKKRVVTEWALNLETSRHSERLLWTIDVVLQSAGWCLQELTGIGVGVGPGSFTGLRIGITTARMLASSLKIPLIPISSLELLARPAAEILMSFPEYAQGLVLVGTDAAKGEWFTLMGSAQGICLGVGVRADEVKERTLAPDDFFSEIKLILKNAKLPVPWLAVGQTVERYPDSFLALPASLKVNIHETQKASLNRAQACTLAQLVCEGVQQGMACDPYLVHPHYLRESDAEVKFKKGLLKVL